MALWMKLIGGVRALFRKERAEGELDEELRGYVEASAEAKMAAGARREDAIRAARLELGSREGVKENVRQAGWESVIESFWQDVRFGARMLRKSPGFTLSAALILALGIGATTVVFSVFDAVLLRPLPVRHPEELVRMVQELPRIGVQSNFPFIFYEALRDHSTTLASVFGETGNYVRYAMTDPKPTEQITIRGVTPEYFDVLGVRALLGRVLTAGDAVNISGIPPVVLSYGFWRRRFTPSEFNGLSADTAPDVRIPLRAYPQLDVNFSQDQNLFELAGRLKPRFTRAQAEAESLAIWKSTMEPYYRDPQKYRPEDASALLTRGMRLDPLERGVSIVRDRFGSVLQLLMALVSSILLIACANLVGLQLARGAARRQEMAVRRSVGATRGRLIQQMLTENSLLMVLGAAGGLWVAIAATPLAVRMVPPMRDMGTSLLPLSLDVGMNGRVFVFSLVLCALALLLVGLTPAIPTCRESLDRILRGARSTSTWRGRQALVVLQVAICTSLLICAALMVRTFQELRGVYPGFDSQHVATFTLDTWAAGYSPATEAAFLRTLREKVQQIPGVVSAAISVRGVMRGRGVAMTTAPAGQRTTQADFLNTDMHMVSPEYFDTMGIRLLAGRTFTHADDPTAKPKKVLVNEAFTRRFFPNSDPIGQHVGNAMEAVAGADYEIVGVVSNAKYRSLRQPILPTLYQPGVNYSVLVLNVRTQVPPESIMQPVQKTLASIDPALAFLEIHTLAEEVDSSVASERLTAVLASIFGGLALLLAGVGLYALLAYSVSQRRGEIGVRRAMGAQRNAVLQMVIMDGMKLALAGVVIGIAGALALTRFLSSLLYGVTPTDPTTFVAVALLLLAVALLACYIPARRAARVDPMTALRHE